MASTLGFRTLMLLVFLAPLPLAANREWAWTFCALVVAGLGLYWAIPALLRPGRVSTAVPLAPLVLFLGACAWAVYQALPSAHAHPLWGLAAEVLGALAAGGVSLSPDDTWMAVLRLASYGLVFFLALQWCREPRRAREALRWMLFAGLAYTVYGLIMFWGEFGLLLWFEDEAFNRDVRGTFVNRNHYATWVGLCLLCALAVFHQGAVVRRNPAYRLPVDRGERAEALILQVWKPLVSIILLTTGLVLTHSRAGFFSVLAAVSVLLWMMHRRHGKASLRLRMALLGAVGTVALVFWLTSAGLLQRMDRLDAGTAERFDAYALTRQGIEDNPLLGFGYGSYADSFRLYRDERLSGFFDKAHNTYLENLFELGWPAALMLFTAVGWCALLCWRGAWRRGRDWIYPATALAASVLVGVHSLFDFSLQIPAVAMLFACLLGIGVAQSHPTGR